MKIPNKIESVVHFFSQLPGVGEKTALRQTLQLTNWQVSELKAFADSLNELSTLSSCKYCAVYCDEKVCFVCSDEARVESKRICVVENVSDYWAIEKSEQYQGLYHVLGGVLNPLLGVGPDQLRIQNLLDRIEQVQPQEIILALNPSVEGDATCAFLRDKIKTDIAVERIGFGIPIGGNLEYLDPLTISKAIENRTVY